MKHDLTTMGLTGLARAGEKGWFEGHFGAGVLAAENLLKRPDFVEGVKEGIRQQRQRALEADPSLFVPFENSPPAADAEARIVKAIEINLEKLVISGHGVIYGALALQALRERPEAGTEAVVSGIERLLQKTLKDRGNRYYGVPDEEIHRVPVDEIPKYNGVSDLVTTAFRESRERYRDGYVGEAYYYFTAEKLHGITFAHAIYLLDRLGYSELARKAFPLHRRMMKLNRMIPPKPEEFRVEELPGVTPFQVSYWQKDHFDDHALKLGIAALELLDAFPEVKSSKVYDPDKFWGPFMR